MYPKKQASTLNNGTPTPKKTMQQMGMTVYESDKGVDIAAKMIKWVKRYMLENTFELHTEEGRRESINWANGSYQCVEILSSDELSAEDLHYHQRLMRSFSDNAALGLTSFIEKAKPCRVSVTTPTGTQIYWTSLNDKNKAHKKGGKLSSEKQRLYTQMVDFKTLLAETYYWNQLHAFLESHPEILKKEIVTYCYSIQPEKESVFVPTEKLFQSAFIQAAKQHLPSLPWKEDKEMERFRTYWEMRNLEHPLMLDWVIPSYLVQFPKIKLKRYAKESERATKVYETNRNIKSSIRQIMKDNAFLSCYGNVELHNDLDIDLFRTMEKDFKQLQKAVPIPVNKDYTLRIKKLGKHHADGLHYPFMKNILVDIHSVHSYVHELGHQIDILYGEGKKKLSDSENFSQIKKTYQSRVLHYIERLPANDEQRIAWEENLTHNHSYYFKPNEIFARCFEIYVDELIRDNCLAKKTLPAHLYPNDKFFRNHINGYFKKIFS